MKKFIFLAILTITDPTTILAQFTLTDSLQLYYTFDGNVTDYSPNQIIGTVNGAALTTNRFGATDAAYYFDGINDYILCDEQDEILNQNFDAFTISVWVNPENLNTGNGGRVINNRGTGSVENGYSGFQMSLVREPSLTQWGISNTAIEDEDDVLWCGLLNFCGDFYDFNTWHHYVMMYDNGTMTLYMDSIIQGIEASSTFNDISNNLPTVIGASGTQSGVFGIFSQFFQGKIDDIRIYNRALSTVEIAQLYVLNDDTLSINDEPINQEILTVYPNPFEEIVQVKGFIGCNYFITKLDGSAVKEGLLESENIDLKAFSKGIYFLSVKSKSGSISTVKLIKH